MSLQAVASRRSEHGLLVGAASRRRRPLGAAAGRPQRRALGPRGRSAALRRSAALGEDRQQPAVADEVGLSNEEIQRYSRHFLLSQVGEKGQRKLLRSKVLLIGAGGLGSPAALYLAAAGVGTIGLMDGDVVDVSNLQRQVLHTTASVGRPKVESGTETIRALNPDVNVIPLPMRIDVDNVMDVIKDYDLVVDGSDNFDTRYLVNDACYLGGKTNVHGSIFQFEGMATVLAPNQGPCYRCLYPTPPPPGLVPS